MLLDIKDNEAIIRLSYSGDSLVMECFADDDEMLAIAQDVSQCYHEEFQRELGNFMEGVEYEPEH